MFKYLVFSAALLLLPSFASAQAGTYTQFHAVSAANTNPTNIKASPGTLHCWELFNTNAAMRKVAMHNTAGAPVAGAGVVKSFLVPPGGGISTCTGEAGIRFSRGIAFTTVTEAEDAGTTGVGAGDLVINFDYR